MTQATTASDRPTLGIIAGGGNVPVVVARAAEASGRPVVLFGIVGEADLDVEAFHHHWLRWGEIGRMFDLLARERVGEVVICGAVNRPDFSAIRVDLGAVLSLPKILSLMVGGDDTVLKNVVRFLEDRDYLVVGAHQVAPELVALDNVVLAPHIGSSTRETRTAMAELVLDNVRSFLERGELLTPCAVPAS